MAKVLFLFLSLIPALAFADSGITADAVIVFRNSPYLAILGLVLIFLEFMLPTKGILGFFGVVLFILGTFALADNADPNLRLSWPSIILMNIIVVGTFIGTLFITLRGYKQKNTNVTDVILNQTGTIIDWKDGHGRVTVGGTSWQAKSLTPLSFSTGDEIVVVAQDNLTLIISPKEPVK